MIINVIVMVIGLLLLIYGIKSKTKFFLVIGLILLCLGLISGFIDYKLGGGEFNNHRVPFTIDHLPGI